MESEGPTLLEGTASFEAKDGIMYIHRGGECRAAMRISTFTQFIAAGTEALRDWHNQQAVRPIRLQPQRRRAAGQH